MAQITLKIEGLEELTLAIITLAGSIQDQTAAMGKNTIKTANIEVTGAPGIIDLKKIAEDMRTKELQDDAPELATRDMYFFNKGTNAMIMIKKGQPIDVTAGYKATTKAKYDEYYGEDNIPTDTDSDDLKDTSDDGEGRDGDGDGEGETITMEVLRAELVALGKAKGKDAAKKIISDLGSPQLTELDPSLYGEAMAAAKALLGK